MGYNINFTSPLVVREGKLKIEGASDPLDGARFLARHVAVRQGGLQVSESAPSTVEGQPGWATPELAADGFEDGPAIATGTETHIVDDSMAQSALSTYVTITWSQLVEIEIET